MKELQKILEVYRRIDFSQRKAALATVVRVEGSSYRRPGARLLMTDDGRWEGAISGGCLEGDALRKARQVILDGKPMLVTYDTMDDDANSLGVGLGCNGIIDVLIEPIDSLSPTNPVRLFEQLVANRTKAVCAVVVKSAGEAGPAAGTRWLLTEQEPPENLPTDFSSGKLLADMKKALVSGESNAHRYVFPGLSVDVFIEVIQPEISLIIFGAGYDAIPLATLAKTMGWHVTVTEDCVAHLAPKRFPAADAVVYAERQAILEKFTLTPRTAAVLLSHNFKYDLAVLEALLPSDVSYIGVLGPWKRYQKIMDAFTKAGKTFPKSVLDRVHAPIGLDLGAETPDEIALSIVAEVQAFFNKRTGGFLKDKLGPIHERVAVIQHTVEDF